MIDKEIEKKVYAILNSVKELEPMNEEEMAIFVEFNKKLKERRTQVQEALDMIAERIETLGLTLAQIKAHPRLTSWENDPVNVADNTSTKTPEKKKRNTNNPKKGILLFLINPKNSAGAGLKIYKDFKIDSIKQESLSKKLLSLINKKGDLKENLMEHAYSEEARSYLETSDGQTFLYKLVSKLKSIRKLLQSVDSEKTA